MKYPRQMSTTISEAALTRAFLAAKPRLAAKLLPGIAALGSFAGPAATVVLTLSEYREMLYLS